MIFSQAEIKQLPRIYWLPKEWLSRLVVPLYSPKSAAKSFMKLQREASDILIDRLSEYGKSELFVIDTKNTAMISLSNLPLALKYHDDQIGAFGEVPIPLWDAGTIPSQVLELLQKVIANMNIVLEQLVPGLTIGVVNLGEQLLESGAKANRIQLVSLKNKKAIPLRFESEGIKKIISVLQLLIVVYNQPSIPLQLMNWMQAF